ncbi:MAG: hypothetical protein KME53_03525 [Candidatus Thiodiazotropha sp. (ex Clathrolucina costata)]|nr:hypothetical protein [Candidatus Thiodiazotropha taylori]
MTLNDVLLLLLEALDSTGEVHLVGWDIVQQWPGDALGTLLEAGILTDAKPALSVECRECANHCFMDVHQLPGSDKKTARAFVICDDPEMQGQMGRIEIPMERLRQWKVTALQLAKVVAELVSIECKAEDRHGQANIRIGMVKGKNGRRWLSLNKSPLTLEINDQPLPLEEVLFFEDDTLTIDRVRIDQLIDKAPSSGGKKYKPSTEKREAGKRKTEAMREDWREAYLDMRRKYPDTVRHSDTWVAKQIAKLDIAQGRDSETIRKNMKP